MQTILVTDAECESLIADQASAWQGQPIGHGGVLPITEATQQAYRNDVEQHNQPWWTRRSHDQQQFSGLLWVEPSMPVFAGHFPGHPILPGVLQIDWVVTVADDVFPATPAAKFCGMSQIKFIQPIAPGSWLHLELTRSDTTVSFTYSNQTGTCTKGKLRYRG